MTEINFLNQGLILTIILIVLYGASFFLFSKKRVYLSLLAIILAGFCLRMFCALDPMLHSWDERYHALVAKNIIEQPLEPKLYKEHIIEYDFKNWTGNKVWLHKQPLPLWSMALSMEIFGVNEVSLRLPSVILSTVCILLTFCIAFLLFNSSYIGLIAAFLHSINGLIIELSSGRVSTDHIDTFFFFFVETSIFFLLLNMKKNKKLFLFFTGIALGAAILTKWLPALIIFPLYLIINYNAKSVKEMLLDAIIIGFTGLLIALPWQIYAQTLYPLEYNWEQYYNALHFTVGLEGHGRPWWYFINQIRININEAIYIVMLWYIYYSLKSINRNKENVFLLAYIFIPILIFSVAQTKMQAYLLFTFPAYFIIIGLFIEKMPKLRKTNISKFIAIIIFIFAVRYGMERVKPFETKNREMFAKQELVSTYFPEKSVLFNIPCPIELMFYTNCIAYPSMPDKSLINTLYDENYNVFIVDNDDLSNEMKKNDKVKIIRLEATMEICK